MKHIVITGVSRGLGRALLGEFSKRGFVVWGTTRNSADAEALSLEYGEPHRFMAVDSLDVDGLVRIAKEADAQGGADIVIANAGIINDRSPIWTISDNTWQRVMDINVLGLVNTIKAFMPSLIKVDRGLFIGMSSGWGRSASAGLGPYCASKFAVEGLMQSLVLDLENINANVTAVSLDPGGGINTDMLASCLPDSHIDYRTPEVWAKGAVNFMLDTLFDKRESGAFEIPDHAHESH